jgi:hypothetical protein
MPGTIAPFPKHFFTDNNGSPAVAHKLFVYETGTTTKTNSYTDVDLTSANTNPIILDSAGRCTIFLPPGSFTFVLAPSTDTDPPTSPLWTQDNVEQVPSAGSNVDIDGVAGETIDEGELVYLEDGTGGTAGRWYLTNNFVIAESTEVPAWGFALNDATVGEELAVRRSGRVTLAGPLTAGTIYYMSDTAGALETPAPTPEAGFEMPYAVGIADSTTTLVFPLSSPQAHTKDALKTIAFSSGQSNAGGGGDTELTSYDVYLPANYIGAAGNALVIEGTMSVAANGDAKTVKVQVGSGTAVTVWSSSANVANHVVPFRIVIRRRTSTTGSISSVFWHGVASGNNADPYMVYTTIGTVAWTSNQSITLYCAANTVTSVTMNDLTYYALRSGNAATV